MTPEVRRGCRSGGFVARRLAGCGWWRGFVGGWCFDGLVPRRRDPDAPRVVYRTARCGLRLTGAQRERVFGLLRSAGDVWCWS
jgi:hypothetical protein